MVQTCNQVLDMSDDDVEAFIGVIVMPPSVLRDGGMPTREWFQRQAERVAKLPRELLGPDSVVDRVRISLASKGVTAGGFLPQVAELCESHKRLNPWLMHRLFTLVKHEATVRVDRLRFYKGELKTTEIVQLVDRLDGLQTLWLEPREFERIFSSCFPTSLRCQYLTTRCEACLLGYIGSRGQILFDLRCSMLARSSKRHPPRLLRFFDGWIKAFGGTLPDRIEEETKRVVPILRRMRKDDRAWERSQHKRRRAELRAQERDLETRRLTASKLRVALGELDKALEQKYGRSNRTGQYLQHRRVAYAQYQQSGDSSALPAVNTKHGHNRASMDNAQSRTTPVPVNRSSPSPNPERPSHADGHYEDHLHEIRNSSTDHDDLRRPHGHDRDYDEHDSGDECDLEQSIINWYAASHAELAAVDDTPKHERSGTNEDDSRPFTEFTYQSAVPSALNTTMKESTTTTDHATSVLAGDDGQWTDVSVRTAQTVQRAPSTLPPVPEVPSQFAAFLDVARGEERGEIEYIREWRSTPSPHCPRSTPRDTSFGATVQAAMAPSSFYSHHNETFLETQIHPSKEDSSSSVAPPTVLRKSLHRTDADKDPPSSDLNPGGYGTYNPFSPISGTTSERSRSGDTHTHEHLHAWASQVDRPSSSTVRDSTVHGAPAGQQLHSPTYKALTGERPPKHRVDDDDDGITVASLIPDDSVSCVAHSGPGAKK